MFQTKVLENLKRHFLRIFDNIFLSEYRAFYEIMWKNSVEPGRTQMEKKRRMRIACYIPKATITHSEYVILTFFFSVVIPSCL